jgi:hypothetical protein
MRKKTKVLVTLAATGLAVSAAAFPTVSGVVGADQASALARPAKGARPDVAADQAAHDILVALYPSMRTDLDAQLATQLSGSHGRGRTAVFVGWGRVTPFLVGSVDRFRPGPPPAVDSIAYAHALDEVKRLGRDTSTSRTPDQTVAGKFWSSTPIWTTWNQVATQLLTDRQASLAQSTRVLATMDLALADTTIGLYGAKYGYDVWRPVTAIRAGTRTVGADRTWNPLTPTAPDPSYPGAHSALSAAAAGVLTAFFGDRQPVDISAAADPGVVRRFAILEDAANEAGLSRIWSGQHTRLDHRAGQQLGSRVAGVALDTLATASSVRSRKRTGPATADSDAVARVSRLLRPPDQLSRKGPITQTSTG